MDQALTIKLKPEDFHRCDVGLYLGEHNYVKEVELRLSGRHIEILGRTNIEMMRQQFDFRIKWLKE